MKHTCYSITFPCGTVIKDAVPDEPGQPSRESVMKDIIEDHRELHELKGTPLCSETGVESVTSQEIP